MPEVKEKEVKSAMANAIMKHETLIPYKPYSICPPINTCIPIGLATETYKALDDIIAEHGNIDDYVLDKLKYQSYIQMADAFGGEQIDAIAMAIYQIEKGKGFILGDMAGVGKGRVCAAVMRYAHHAKKFPVFFTYKSNLFSNIYSDIKDIGGFYVDKSGQPYMPEPFIMNANSSDSKSDIIDLEEEGDRLVILKKSMSSEDIKKTIAQPVSKTIKNFDCLFSTYSQFQDDRAKDRKAFLEEVAQHAVFILDESHNVCGASKTGKSKLQKYFALMLSFAKGAMFSSATYAKTAMNMKTYAPFTDMNDTQLGMQGVIDAITKGGSQLQEYMSSNLTRAGQYVRRERSFNGCNVYYRYNDKETKEESFLRYDNSIEVYLKIQKFAKSSYFSYAKKNAITRFADKHKISVVTNKNFGKTNSKERETFVEENLGKYFIDYSAGKFMGNSFQFIEALLFALKSEYVYQTIIEQLTEESENKDSNFNSFKSTRKVILGVRSTLENVYHKLGLKEGSTIKRNDFSLYFVALIKQLFIGDIYAFEITKEFITTPVRDIAKSNWKTEGEFKLLRSDFEDEGVMYDKLYTEIENFNSDLPLSPIDYIINKIENTKRPANNKWGSGAKNFVVTEVTGRKYMLQQQGEGIVIRNNKKEKNKSAAFNSFNNGTADVLLLNLSGSTGASAHASVKFKDKRPRCMVIHQVELDVNVEVQKRGRINRTGQVNLPSYIYAISLVPSEIRRLLMLRFKLRSLDANTSANQLQSNRISDIEDKDGKPIEDFSNKYGGKIIEEFIEEEEGIMFKQYMPTHWSFNSLQDEGAVDLFLQKLQFAKSIDQELFYNRINSLYLARKNSLIEEGNWDLDTEIEDLQASKKSRITKMEGDNSNPFTSSVYEEDYHVNRKHIYILKEERDDIVAELCESKDRDVFMDNLIKGYTKYMNEEYIPAVITDMGEADIEGIKDEQKIKEIKEAFSKKVENKKINLEKERDEMLHLFDKFQPKTAILMPMSFDCELEHDADIDSLKGEDKVIYHEFITQPNSKGMFLGYKILKGSSANKYTRSNIEMVFATLDGLPKQTIKPTRANYWGLKYMESYENMPSRFDLELINDWKVSELTRDIARIFTGNLFDGYVLAENTFNEDKNRGDNRYFKAMRFTRFTLANSEETRVGIRLLPNHPISRSILTPNTKRLVAFGTEEFNKAILKLDRQGRVKSMDNSVIIYRKKYGDYTIYVNGGVRKGDKIIDIAEITPAPYYGDQEFIDYTGKHWDYGTYKFRPPSRSKMIRPSVMYCEVSENSIESFIDKMTKYCKVQFTMEGSSLSDYFAKEDAFVDYSKEIGEAVRESEKEVAYYNMAEFKEGMAVPPNFLRYEAAEKGGYDKGVTYLMSVLPPKVARNFGLVPKEPSVNDAVVNFFALLREESKRTIWEELKDAIDKGLSDAQVGSKAVGYVQSPKHGNMANFRYVFGFITFEQVGKVFKEYVEKNRGIKTPDVIAEPATAEEEEIAEGLMKEVSKPLNMRNAQKYIILLRSKHLL